MYYSWTNINASPLANNTFTYQTRIAGVLQPATTVTIPDGIYEVSQLNQFLQFTFINAGFYLINSLGQNVYYAEFVVNPTLYAVEVNCFGISVAVATANAWVLPAAPTWVLPNNFIVPELNVPASPQQFGLVIGFAAGSYPNATIAGVPPAQVQTPAYTTTQTFVSSVAPQVTPLSSFILTCSLINNNYAVPNNLIYSFAPVGTIGQQFTIAPNQYVFIDVLPAQYNRFNIQFIDQNFRPVSIQDPNMIIQLVISDIEDNLGL
jgi:hypothetical protein